MLVLAVSFLMISGLAKAQVYANSQSTGTNGICLGCGITNAGNAVDNNLNSFANMNVTAGLLGASAYMNLGFPIPATAGSTINLVVESPSTGLLNASVLGGLQLSSSLNGVSNGSLNSSGINIQLFPGSTSRYVISFTPCCSFNTVRVQLNAGLVSVLSQMRIYSASYTIAPLPVELLAMNVVESNNQVNISWSTASEHNNNFFAIERSSDGANFEEIGTVQGAGNSSVKKNYSFVDKKIVNGQFYYRLSQIDFDGSTKYLGVKDLEIVNAIATAKMNISRDANGQFQLNCSGLELNQKYEINFYNTLGSLVKSESVDANTTELSYPINIDYESKLLFLIVTSNNKEVFQQKILMD